MKPNYIQANKRIELLVCADMLSVFVSVWAVRLVFYFILDFGSAICIRKWKDVILWFILYFANSAKDVYIDDKNHDHDDDDDDQDVNRN